MPGNAAALPWTDMMSISSNRPHDDDPLAPHRGRLLGLAYRVLGSRSDAEDVVQDAYLRFAGAQDVHNAEAFLVTVVTRLCLDRLKSARAQREVYVGPWLPEPVFDAEGLSADAATELADKVARFFIGLAGKIAGQDVRIQPAVINGAVGALLYLDGELDLTLSMAIDGEKIAAIYIVRNPDKLRHLPAAASN